MQVLLHFFNGDQMLQEVAGVAPPGRMAWADSHTPDSPPTREFWLDTTKWSTDGRAEYREVALIDGRVSA